MESLFINQTKESVMDKKEIHVEQVVEDLCKRFEKVCAPLVCGEIIHTVFDEFLIKELNK